MAGRLRPMTHPISVAAMSAAPKYRRLFALLSMVLMVLAGVAIGQARAAHLGAWSSAAAPAPCHHALDAATQPSPAGDLDRCRELCVSTPSDLAGELAVAVNVGRAGPDGNAADAAPWAHGVAPRAWTAPAAPHPADPPRPLRHVTPRLLI